MSDASEFKPAGYWSVFDDNARKRDPKTGNAIPRVHETVSGRQYAMTAFDPAFMPEQDARQFLRDDAFRVLDANDNPVLPLKQQAMQRDMPKRLEPGFVIAELNDLTSEALVTRAAMFPGGDDFDAESPRTRMIEFIKAAQERADVASAATDDGTDARYEPADMRGARRQSLADVPTDPDEMTADELADALTGKD